MGRVCTVSALSGLNVKVEEREKAGDKLTVGLGMRTKKIFMKETSGSCTNSEELTAI
jgi:hypothetical protein